MKDLLDSSRFTYTTEKLNKKTNRLKKVTKVVENKSGEDLSTLIAMKLVDMAVEGDKWAINQVLDRTEGKPAQTQIIETPALAAAKLVFNSVAPPPVTQESEIKDIDISKYKNKR